MRINDIDGMGQGQPSSRSSYPNISVLVPSILLTIIYYHRVNTTIYTIPSENLCNAYEFQIFLFILYFSVNLAVMSSHSKILWIGAVHCMKYNERLKLDSEFFVPL